MVVNHEIKSQLAKLLATEDLIVEHRVIETAQFDVHTRVLTLPKWDKASNGVYDCLVAHEVGHALYTPDRDWFLEVQIPPTFVNIVEDARIEKLMKRRYAGLAKTFYNGYNELNDQDFFEIEDEDLNDFNLADRINLYCKIGAWNNISFSPTETPIINLIQNVETFDETLSAAEALYNFCKQQLKDEKEEISLTSDSEDSGVDDSGINNIDSSTDSRDIDNSDMETDVDPDYRTSNDVGGVSNNDEPEVHTTQTLEDSLKGLTDTRNNLESTYFELPDLELKRIIIDNKVIHDDIDLSWKTQTEDWRKSLQEKGLTTFSEDLFGEVDEEFVKFKRNAQKEVSYLVKEFECKKSASAYARATTARTGVLDVSNLHTYKYNEDLFKKITILPDGKNHGLVFILDWSGSMSNVMLDTIKQLYNLLWFCKKVSIPFEVYAFTNEYPPNESIHRLAYEKKEGLAFVAETFSLMNLFTSKVRSKVLEDQMKNIFRIGVVFSRGMGSSVYYSIPLGMTLSGTPLNESLIALHQILPQFKKEHNLEKVQCVVLSDGEGAPIRYSKEFRRHWEENPYMGTCNIHERCILRNRKTGYSYSCEGLAYWGDFTDLLLKDLRQTFSDMNFIGIRILNNRDAAPFIRRYAGLSYASDSYDNIMKGWRKNKAFTIKNSGYHSYFGLSSSALSNDDEFEVEKDATKAQIKKAFVNSLKGKKMNKKILGEFVELIA